MAVPKKSAMPQSPGFETPPAAGHTVDFRLQLLEQEVQQLRAEVNELRAKMVWQNERGWLKLPNPTEFKLEVGATQFVMTSNWVKFLAGSEFYVKAWDKVTLKTQKVVGPG